MQRKRLGLDMKAANRNVFDASTVTAAVRKMAGGGKEKPRRPNGHARSKSDAAGLDAAEAAVVWPAEGPRSRTAGPPSRLATTRKLAARSRPTQLPPACKTWLDHLPAGTKLEPVAVTADGHDLAGGRGRIKAANAELEALERAPAPSEDIEARVRDYVRGLRRRCGASASASASASCGQVPSRRPPGTSPSTHATRWRCSPRCSQTGCSVS